MSDEYNASSIKVLSTSVVEQTQPWVLLDRWVTEYTGSPRDFLKTGLDACLAAQIHPKYFEIKYLMKEPLSDHGLEEVSDFSKVYAECVKTRYMDKEARHKELELIANRRLKEREEV